ncbi:MAG: hypothetical protein FWC97_10055 [Treponema sp.]|nr:hypothetical protein [Treponema sp.]
MKRLLLIILPLFVLSCDFYDYNFHTVVNETQRTIFYTFNGSANMIIPYGSNEYRTTAGTRFTGIGNIDAGSPHGFDISVRLVRSGTTYTFISVEPYKLDVINTLPIAVTISAGGFIKHNGDETSMLIPASPDRVTAEIFTSNPTFTTTANFPVNFEWNFVRGTEGADDTVYLIIR